MSKDQFRNYQRLTCHTWAAKLYIMCNALEYNYFAIILLLDNNISNCLDVIKDE